MAGVQIAIAELLPITDWPILMEEIEIMCTVSNGTSKLESPEFILKQLNAIPEEYRTDMAILLTRYSNLFQSDQSLPLQATTAAEHHIDTGSDPPIRSAPYRVSRVEREVMQAEINEMLNTGIATHSSSAWSSPVVIVPPKNGELRL